MVGSISKNRQKLCHISILCGNLFRPLQLFCYGEIKDVCFSLINQQSMCHNDRVKTEFQTHRKVTL